MTTYLLLLSLSSLPPVEAQDKSKCLRIQESVGYGQSKQLTIKNTCNEGFSIAVWEYLDGCIDVSSTAYMAAGREWVTSVRYDVRYVVKAGANTMPGPDQKRCSPEVEEFTTNSQCIAEEASK